MSTTKTVEAQEIAKAAKGYKIMYGNFKKREEAVRSAAEARKKGFAPLLVIESSRYKLLYADKITKSDADKCLKEIKGAGLTAELYESK